MHDVLLQMHGVCGSLKSGSIIKIEVTLMFTGTKAQQAAQTDLHYSYALH